MKAKDYANYLLVNKNVLYCPVKGIHTTRTAATYIEGKQEQVILIVSAISFGVFRYGLIR